MPADLRSQIKALAPKLREARAVTEVRERAARQVAARDAHEKKLFAQATHDVQPLRAAPRRTRVPPPSAPLPLMRERDEAAALQASLSDGIDADALLDSDAALSFTRDGLAPNTARKLRRGDWVIQAQLDLHGLTRDDAREALSLFLASALKQGQRCVRVVHGKGLGSKHHIPVLRDKVRRWLTQSDAVLAWVQARAPEGGTGALVVLLRNP